MADKEKTKKIKKKKKTIKKDDNSLVMCPNCGSQNIKRVNKCLMCGQKLVGAKSCPKCAKINTGDAKKCINCGFKFTNKKIAVLISFIFSVMLSLTLSLLIVFRKDRVVINFIDSFRWVAVGIIVIIVIRTFTYGRKEKIDYDSKYNKIKLCYCVIWFYHSWNFDIYNVFCKINLKIIEIRL